MLARNLVLAVLAMCVTFRASAHAFVQSYSLPVPFAMYATGAALALVMSFIAAAVFAKAPNVHMAVSTPQRSVVATSTAAVAWGRCVSVMVLLLCVLSGLIGTSDAFRNINMTLFWIMLFLGVPYAIVLFGDFYAAINPWSALVSGIEKLTAKQFTGRVAYPAWLGHFPGLVLYIALIATELFGQLPPFGLSVAIGTYTTIIVVGAWIFGKEAWLSHAEVFGIICRLLGQMSMRARPGTGGLRMPAVGVLEKYPADAGLILFVLFMLSSTAFDGFHSTIPWLKAYWEVLYPRISWVDTAWTSMGGNRYAASAALYQVWQWVGLVLSPFVYLGVFALFIRLCAIAGRSRLGTRALMARFTFSLLPIAFVYHVSHYFTLLLMQGPKIVQLVSDPFGFGWNLFGTAHWRLEPITLDMTALWHTQVGLIVAGHVASVLVAHMESLRTFGTPRQATLSQLPMLVLMVLFTASGLWILSLPMTTS